MKFKSFDAMMRVYETSLDQTVLPDMYVVARLDGRSFHRLTKDVLALERPYDARFKDLMVETTKHLVGQCGFNIRYGYVESDEISLMIDQHEESFGRLTRKWLSILAGEASAVFSRELWRKCFGGSETIKPPKEVPVTSFDCRLCQFPRWNSVIDYFRWRQSDAHRNSLNSHCFYALLKSGMSSEKAYTTMQGWNEAAMNDHLFRVANINYNDLPSWQKRGYAVYYKLVQKEAVNLKTNEKVIVNRRKLVVDEELPLREDYSTFLKRFIPEVPLGER